MKYVVSHAVKYVDSPLYTSTLWIPAVENLPFFFITLINLMQILLTFFLTEPIAILRGNTRLPTECFKSETWLRLE